jgi:hypothetical protein
MLQLLGEKCPHGQPWPKEPQQQCLPCIQKVLQLLAACQLHWERQLGDVRFFSCDGRQEQRSLVEEWVQAAIDVVIPEAPPLSRPALSRTLDARVVCNQFWSAYQEHNEDLQLARRKTCVCLGWYSCLCKAQVYEQQAGQRQGWGLPEDWDELAHVQLPEWDALCNQTFRDMQVCGLCGISRLGGCRSALWRTITLPQAVRQDDGSEVALRWPPALLTNMTMQQVTGPL